jgi:hypothetical protein
VTIPQSGGLLVEGMLERLLAEAEEASAVAVHPGAVKFYLCAVDRLQ